MVLVKASGFSPDESLVITQCANKGASTTQADCNLTGVQFVTSDSSGDVSQHFAVIKGPFGANGIVCSTPRSCLVSVSQATTNPTQQADTIISFK